MKNLRKHLLVGMTALSLGAGALVVHAAEGAAAGDKPKAEAQAKGKQKARAKERMAKRQNALHDKLKLTAEQEAAWAKYTEALKPVAPPARPDRAKLAAMTAPERMDAVVAHMKESEVRLSNRAAAVKEFYAVLTPEQQKVYDQHFSRVIHAQKHAGKRAHRHEKAAEAKPSEAKPS